MDSRNNIFSKIISDELFAPEIGGVYVHTFAPGYRMEAHSHDSVEVISVLHGSSFMVINNQYIRIRKNECFIIFPNIRHSFFLEKNESCRLINVHFKPGGLSDFFTIPDLQAAVRFFYELRTNTLSYLRLVDNQIVRNISERILKEQENRTEYSELLSKLYFCELYVQLSKIMSDEYSRLRQPVNKYVLRALEFIQNFFCEELTLGQVAAHTGISSRHLTRLFSEHLKTGVQDYIHELRIQKARELLENTHLSITAIAQSIGFSTSQYFTTCFRKQEAVTPKKYRQLLVGRKLNKF